MEYFMRLPDRTVAAPQSLLVRSAKALAARMGRSDPPSDLPIRAARAFAERTRSDWGAATVRSGSLMKYSIACRDARARAPSARPMYYSLDTVPSEPTVRNTSAAPL